jgi:hypothetical protein
VDINRSAVLVRPRQPYLDWADALADGLDYPRDMERTVYLLPDFIDATHAQEVLRHYYDLIFEEELEAWMTDPALWPEDRGYETFLEWFEVEQGSVVMDLVAGDPIVEAGGPGATGSEDQA